MDSVVHRHRNVTIRRITPVALAVGMLTLAACRQPAAESPPEKRKPQQAGQPVSAIDMARHVAAARVAAATGNSRQTEQHIKAMASDITRSARMADPMRPINPEAARAAARTIHGVRSAIWLDRANLVVMVAGAQYRNMDMIDEVCLALEPLGDTLAIVVNVQDVTATTPDSAHTLSRNCQLGEGERAFLQKKREVDVVSKELRETFKGMQETRK
jgi:hypothetical protein